MTSFWTKDGPRQLNDVAHLFVKFEGWLGFRFAREAPTNRFTEADRR